LLGGDRWTVYRFLNQCHPELSGDTAISGLQRGKVSQVLAAAENTVLDRALYYPDCLVDRSLQTQGSNQADGMMLESEAVWTIAAYWVNRVPDQNL
jgi:hypothetical protein